LVGKSVTDTISETKNRDSHLPKVLERGTQIMMWAFSDRYGLKIQHLQIFLVDKQVSGENYLAEYVLTFFAMNHSGQFAPCIPH